jgi:drug/metabolite transporter (DMT)-like permease
LKRYTTAWTRLMLIAFVANGVGPFGLKVLSERNLAAFQPQYLLYWYVGGFCFALAALLRTGVHVGRWEVLLGAAMGACSFSGQAFTGLALSHGIPGHIAFPLTTGGSLFLVAGTGIVLFKEKVGRYGIAGLALGILALVLLSAA